MRLWVDGTLIINNWTSHIPTENSGAIRLEAGKKHDIKLEFYENGGSAVMKRSWSAPGLAKEIIPQAQLYPRDLHNIYLDVVYSQLVTGSWVVLSVPDYQEVYSIESVAEDSRANFTLNAKTTRLTLKGENPREKYDQRLRETAAFAQGEELLMAARPIFDPIQGNTITLDHLVLGLEGRRILILSGKHMRAHVLQQVKLTAADGTPREFQAGDNLQVVQAPTQQSAGQVKWSSGGFLTKMASLALPQLGAAYLSSCRRKAPILWSAKWR